MDPNGEDDDNSDSYLTADMNISCNSSYYSNGVLYAAMMIVVYPIGIPLMYLYLLYSVKTEIKGRAGDYMPATTVDGEGIEETSHNPMVAEGIACGDVELSAMNKVDITGSSLIGRHTDNRYEGDVEVGVAETSINTDTDANIDGKRQHQNGQDEQNSPSEVPILAAEVTMLSFLWDSYKPQYWYWEVMETTRRLVLTSVLAVCGPGTSSQAVLAILLSLMYIKLYSYASPYASNSSNTIAETGQFQIFFTFFGGLIIGNTLVGTAYNALLGWFLILINTSVVVLASCLEVEDVIGIVV